MIAIHDSRSQARAAQNADNDSTGDQWHEKLRDGSTVLIRALRYSDIELERRFIAGLSPQSRRFRFFCQLSPADDAMLEQLVRLDPRRDVAFIALVADGAVKREVGVARFSTAPSGLTCECAVTVADEWQHRGLATLLMTHLIHAARARGIARMVSFDLPENTAMRDLAQQLGFERAADPEDPRQVMHTLVLRN